LAVADCTQGSFDFPACRKRSVAVDFSGGAVSSNGGVLLLRAADRRLGLSAAAAQVLRDPREPGRCRHSAPAQLRQRLYSLALGYEDLNDHGELRQDLALQTAVDRIAPLASAPTLCRFEHWADRGTAVALNRVLVEQFIASFAAPPEEIVLDFDATDVPVHGHQEGRFFHGFYDHHCFLPLYVFCGEHLLVAYLRPSKIDAAKHSRAILALLVKRLRQVWPGVRVVLRADSGFCRPRLLAWCERHAVGYILGLAKNPRLIALAEPWLADAKAGFAETGDKQRRFGEFRYAAQTWTVERRVITRVEHDRLGANLRFVVTNLAGAPAALYKDLYCARGDMENRIKEQFELFADRTSCHHWWPNQFRLLLAGFAYTLLTAIRRLGLTATELARAQVGTIRLKLLRIGAVIWRNTRRIRFCLSSACPDKDLFMVVAQRLTAG
jgi:Transposase DDE domain group 1